MEEINILQECLSILNNHLEKSKNGFEKIIILSQINELVFWIEMYKARQANKDL